jgi:peroxiredoxin
MKKMTILLLVLISFTFYYACNKDSDAKTAQTEAPEKTDMAKRVARSDRPKIAAPDFALRDEDGNTIRLSDYKGKAVLLNFWATWCGPCKREIPGFVKLYNEYKDKGFEIIGISLDQAGWEAIKPFADKYDITYPIVLFDRKVIIDYGGISSIPTTFLINEKGEVIERIIGLRPDAYFESKVKEMLSES